MMLKIEQERINWLSDFTALADEYVDKKVRLSLRAKCTSADTKFYNAYDNRVPGKVVGGSNYRYQSKASSNKSLQNVICWQWNFKSCSYGDKCKRWHACRTCAEAGKLGESHKASSHLRNSSLKAKPGESRG